MMNPRKERGQVLIVMGLWWLLFGGGAATTLVVSDRSVSELKKAVKRVIPDSRRDVILFDIQLWESGQEKRDEAVRADRRKLLETLLRKDAQRSDVAPIAARLDAAFLEMDRDFLDLRFAAKDKATSAEWAELVARGAH